MNSITIEDKTFDIYMTEKDIHKSVIKVANEINEKYQGKKPIFLGILNGAFMFAAELFKNLTIDCQISFVKVSSYSGTKSTEHVKQLIGFDIPLAGRNVIITEDIIDTGLTIGYILEQLKSMNVANVAIATLLFKPNSFKEHYSIDFIGKEVPNDFIVGFGFDYNGYGRNYKNIYKLKPNLTSFALTGAPGAGKGTQSQLLKEKYKIAYISTGDALRAEIAAETELGKKISTIISNGELVPDEIVIEIIKNTIDKAKKSDAQSILFDGFPRTLCQAEMLDALLAKENIPFKGIIDLNVSEQILTERIINRGKTSNRSDDDVETLQRRLKEYYSKTKPIIEYYRKQNKLFEVNGIGKISTINKDICNIVDKIIK